MPQYICGGSKYHILGDSGRDYLCLTVSTPALPEAIEFEGMKLLRKAEFHVTLFAIGKIVQKYGITDQDFSQKVTDTFCKFIAEHPVDFVKFTGEFRVAREGEKTTVVAMCEILNFAELTTSLDEHFGLQRETPPAHVTLYSRDPQRGIALLNQDDLTTLTKVIPTPETLRSLVG